TALVSHRIIKKTILHLFTLLFSLITILTNSHFSLSFVQSSQLDKSKMEPYTQFLAEFMHESGLPVAHTMKIGDNYFSQEKNLDKLPFVSMSENDRKLASHLAFSDLVMKDGDQSFKSSSQSFNEEGMHRPHNVIIEQKKSKDGTMLGKHNLYDFDMADPLDTQDVSEAVQNRSENEFGEHGSLITYTLGVNDNRSYFLSRLDDAQNIILSGLASSMAKKFIDPEEYSKQESRELLDTLSSNIEEAKAFDPQNIKLSEYGGYSQFLSYTQDGSDGSGFTKIDDIDNDLGFDDYRDEDI
ncbi:MAG: Unknown protein, partial [uncultured Campylobacterales bacterium]